MIHSKQLTREDSLPKELADTIFRELEGVVARRFCPCLAPDICQKLLTCFAA